MKHSEQKIGNLLWLFFGGLLLLQMAPSCSCRETFALPDLVIESLSAPPTIQTGTAFPFLSETGNLPDDAPCAVTLGSKATNNRLQVFWMDSTDYQLIAQDSTITQPPLEPGQLSALSTMVTVNKAGDYRFDYYLDDAGLVHERDEQNNKSERSSGPGISNNFLRMYLHVDPAANGATVIPGRPAVEFH